MTDHDLAYEHNGQRVPRERFYAIACDPRRSVAVEACAGAGKTWMLVSRIVRALLEGSPPHEILAITFTKKAAGEMRERLQEWLADFAAMPYEQRVAELRARGVPEAQMVDPKGLQPAVDLGIMLSKLQQDVFAAGRPVQVRTFHSWFAALLRTAPLAVLEQLGLPTSYDLLQDDAEAVARVWRRFYSVVLDDAALHADFDALVAVHGRSQTHKALAAALQRRIEFTLADGAGVVEGAIARWETLWPDMATGWSAAGGGDDDPGASSARPVDWLLSQRDALYAASRALGRASAKTFSAAGAALEQAATAGDAAGIRAALLTQAGEPRKFNDKLDGIDAVRAAQEMVQRCADAESQHAAWLHHHRMARLVRVLVAEYAALKREHGWVDMNDVERAAQAMLSDPVLAGWVQQRLDARVRHLLVDEFQDTNPLQWQALQAWLSGYVGAGAGDAPSVFLVGDPKQSIYRFRRAEPQVFRAAQRFVVEGLGGDRLACDHTRRNATAVIDAVNAAMGAAQEAGEYDGFRTHTTESHAVGKVLRLPVVPREDKVAADDDHAPAWRDSLTTPRVLPEDTLRHRECRQAADWLVAQMRERGLHPRDVMVLARRRVALSAMDEALRVLHVPAQQPEKTDLRDAPEVQDVVALLDALLSDGHDLSLARALKSPIFGFSDDDLVQLALARQRLRAAAVGDGGGGAEDAGSGGGSGEGRARRADTDGDTWWSLLQRPDAQVPADLLPRLQATGATLLRWRGWLDRLPPHDAVDAIYHDGDVLARFAAAAPAALRSTVVARLRAVPGAALQIDAGRFSTPYGFVRKLRAGGVKAPVRADADAVRLLTVHGAKGLEAELVLLLDTDAAPARGETMGVLVDWPGEAPVPQSLLFFASESKPPPGAAAAIAAEQVERRREELNGLYVATTRARGRLVLSCVEPHRAPVGSWWRRMEALAEPVEAAPAPAAAASTAASADIDFDIDFEDVAAFQDLPLEEGGGEGRARPAPVPLPDAETFYTPYLPLAVEGYRLPAIDSIAIAPPEQRKAEAAIGQAMHRMLEWAQAGDTAISDAQRDAAAREWGLDAAEAARAAALAQAVRHGDGRWVWDDALLDWQGNEVPISHIGQPLRIDRLVRRRDSGEWWVLDYKSAGMPERQPELVAQLQSYRAAVQAAFPGEPVLAAFLTGRGTVAVVEADTASGMPPPAARVQPEPPPAVSDRAATATMQDAVPDPVPTAVAQPDAVPPPAPIPPTSRRKPTPPPPAPPSAQGDLFS